MCPRQQDGDRNALDDLLSELVEYYSNHRSHRKREWLSLIRDLPEVCDTLKPEQIEVRSHVGRLVKPIERWAAQLICTIYC